MEKFLKLMTFGDTTRNVTPQNFKSHPTLEQHRTHFFKKINILFTLIYISCKIWNSTEFFKNNLNIPMSGQGNVFKK